MLELENAALIKKQEQAKTNIQLLNERMIDQNEKDLNINVTNIPIVYWCSVQNFNITHTNTT